MTKISRITTQQKAKQRYNIYLTDDKSSEYYGFSVDQSVLVEFQLRKGMELSSSMIATIEQKDSVYKSYTLAIRYLSYRMRTKKEIHNYLLKKEVDPNHIAIIIDKLIKENLIDDFQFAEMFVRTRINTSTKGPTIIKRELMEKGVPEHLIDRALQPYSFELQYEKVRKLAKKKLQQKKKDSFQKQLQSLQVFLQQKGFSSDVIQTVIDEYKDTKNDYAEWEAIVYHGKKLIKRHTSKQTGFELKQKVKEGLFRKGFSFDLICQFVDDYMEK
ncbi:recombination regulator RecX [Virgibacillus proomii]|uniref:recombination regulator RecX n=1 Tax=Virgibacillus proomii TaxID=84407 RepID=UPI0009871C77|nr:recombination regulator RecX [Virgibacillus proomii]